jgi:predicted metal-dependent phosphoesterase TrpH
MYKVDLHTHSIASPDGSISAAQYRQMLKSGQLDAIAITDHNRIDFALHLHRELGAQIIVGEEITTVDGEIIGLYLAEAVPAGLTAKEAVDLIKEQGGLVYVPHPFETVRKGISREALNAIAADVDIIETRNGRAVFQNRGQAAERWSVRHKVPGAASSDAHGLRGWGRTFSELHEAPTRQNLTAQLQRAHLYVSLASVRALLYPKFNRLRKRISRGRRA